jgi:hypothetical protein
MPGRCGRTHVAGEDVEPYRGPVDGVIHQFWTMGAPLAATIIINRAAKK